MSKNGVSIIIPCYNAEKHLDRCISSIINQKSWVVPYEIILIDDFSSDNTLKKINIISKKNKNIVVIKNKKNMGAGYSRNAALAKSKYDIISFIDSDDYVESNFYEEMLRPFENKKTEVAVCDIFIRYNDIKRQDIRSRALIGKNDKFNYINNGLAASPCNKLIKKSLLIKYPFADGIMNEDIPTILSILYSTNSINYVEGTFYNYVQHKNSVQNKEITDKRFDIFSAVSILNDRTNIKNKDKEMWDCIIYNQVILLFFYVLTTESNFKKRVHFFKKFYKCTRDMNFHTNHFYWDFIDNQGKYHKIYYKILLKLNENGFSFIASLVVSLFNFLSLFKKESVIPNNINMNTLLTCAKKQKLMKKNKKTLSVVIPNYNYSEFLFQRLYSILNQNIKIDEVIILDDCSSDNSIDLIDKIVDNLKQYINIRSNYNITNSGSAFRQWRKGFDIATSDYVWIAEADDYCEKNFLKKVFRPMLKEDSIVLSYSDTAFIDKNGKKILRTIKPEIDIMKSGHWNKSYINSGKDEIENYSFLNCTIANVSSVIFKKANYDDFFKLSGEYRQAGDWLFYINVMSTGKISFYNRALNYYRVHGDNVTSLTKKQAHFDEIKRVHNYIKVNYGINEEQNKEINKRYDFLKKVWDLNE